ncbi:Surfeit locus protein 1 [Agyrium rufum]|nr:Surfeit locus protein 1 [Agyrium rufum]
MKSIVDQPPRMIRSGKRHGLGLIILALIPVTAFALGTWQVFRLEWKSKLIAQLEDRLVRPPLALPPQIDPAAVPEFDFRRIHTTGHYRHDLEMLIGPRMRDSREGYFVITPLEREDGGSTILVNRGWIAKTKRLAKDRPEGLSTSLVTVKGLLREPLRKNLFTPDNEPGVGAYYFPDVEQMAQVSGSAAIWVEETMEPDLLKSYDREAKGIPIGRAPAVDLRNNHTQYIFTW